MPTPRLPAWKQVEGPAGQAIKTIRDTISGVLDQQHLFGNHIQVTFPSSGVSVRVSTGLSGPTHGYRVEKSAVDVRVFDGTPPAGINPIPNGEAYLQASAAATVTLYIY